MKFPQAIAALVIVAICGCKAGAPSKTENTVMNEVKHEVTIGGKDVQNPIAYTPDAVKEGSEHFQHHCQICHGLDGQNTGVPFADSISPPVPSLKSPEIQSYSDGQLKWVVENGIAPSGMPASKGILSDDEIWSTVLFIRQLPPAGSLGDPPMYSK